PQTMPVATVFPLAHGAGWGPKRRPNGKGDLPVPLASPGLVIQARPRYVGGAGARMALTALSSRRYGHGKDLGTNPPVLVLDGHDHAVGAGALVGVVEVELVLADQFQGLRAAAVPVIHRAGPGVCAGVREGVGAVEGLPGPDLRVTPRIDHRRHVAHGHGQV